MPLAKQMNYRTRILMQDDNLWLVTASYKECDSRTQQKIAAMLESVSIIYP